MATKLTCDFCGEEIKPPESENLPDQHPSKKCTVAIYRDGSDTEMLDRDACSTCADLIARILARANRMQLALWLDSVTVR